MVYFPERQPDGLWVAKKIFTKRIPHTVDFQIDGAEFDLYRDVTRFVKRESARAAAQGEDPRARARATPNQAMPQKVYSPGPERPARSAQMRASIGSRQTKMI